MSDIQPYLRNGGSIAGAQPNARGSDAQQLWSLLAVLRKRRYLFAAIAAGFTLLVILVTALTPKSYTTSVRMMAGRPSDDVAASSGSDTALPVLNALVLQSGVQSAETFAELAQQRDIAVRVIDSLDLKMTPKQLLGNVAVKPVVNTGLLTLSVKWRTPEDSARIANAFASAFIEQEREYVRAEAVAAIGYLSTELPAAQAEKNATASRLAQFQSAHGYMDAKAQEQDTVGRIAATDGKIDQLTVDRKEAQALLDSVTAQLATISSTEDSARQIAQNPITSDLRAKLADIDTQLATAEQRDTPLHPAVVALRQQRAALLAQLAGQPSLVVSQTTLAPNPVYQSLEQDAATYRARIEGDSGQLTALAASRAALRPAAAAMPQEAVQFDSLSEAAQRAANVYNALAQKYNDAVIAKSTAIADIIIVQAASADDAVKSPSLVVNALMGLAAGLLLAFGTIVSMEALEHRRGVTDVSGDLGLPVIARIPMFAAPSARALPWVHSMTVEAFLHLCVTLHLGNKRRMRSLSIVSARRGEGKSTIAYNLAKALALLSPRVLLVDGDLRQPTLHEKAKCSNAIGLKEVLDGSLPLGEGVVEIAPGLDLLTSRGDIDNPVVTLQCAFASLLDTAKARYEMVVVDAPALGAVSDGLVIATHVDGSLLVVAADAASSSDAKDAVARMKLAGIENVLGVVVNRDAPVINDYDDYFAKIAGAAAAAGTAT